MLRPAHGQAALEKTRLSPGGFTASPSAHNGKIFCLSELAETSVVKAGPQFELLGRNALQPEPCLATPALVGDSILLRTASCLYRIRAAAPPPTRSRSTLQASTDLHRRSRNAGNVTDADGNVYQTVKIEEQVGMAEKRADRNRSDEGPP